MRIAKIHPLLLISVLLVGYIGFYSAISASIDGVVIRSTGTIETLASSLHVEGMYIKDNLGNIVYLRGVQIGPDFADSATASWMFSEGWDSSRAAQHLDIVKNWGGNCIRMHVAIRCWKENLVGSTGYTHRQAVKELLSLLADRNMHLIYDFYSIRPYPYAFPAITPWGEPGDTSWLPWPPWQLGGAGARDPFYEEIIGSQQDFIDVCASVATELKTYPNFIFELWNEPHPPDAMSEWYPVAQQCVNAIRDQGAQWMVIFQYGYGAAPSVPISDWVYDCVFAENLNVLISTHIYPVYGGLGGARTYEAIEDALLTMDVTNWTQYHPLFVGETGATYSEDDIWTNLLQHYHDKDIHYIAFWFRTEGVFPLISDVNFTPTSAGQILIDALG